MICSPFYIILHSMADQIAVVNLSCVVGLNNFQIKQAKNSTGQALGLRHIAFGSLRYEVLYGPFSLFPY